MGACGAYWEHWVQRGGVLGWAGGGHWEELGATGSIGVKGRKWERWVVGHPGGNWGQLGESGGGDGDVEDSAGNWGHWDKWEELGTAFQLDKPRRGELGPV